MFIIDTRLTYNPVFAPLNTSTDNTVTITHPHRLQIYHLAPLQIDVTVLYKERRQVVVAQHAMKQSVNGILLGMKDFLNTSG